MIAGEYVKYVDFQKAVLWFAKSLSVPPQIMDYLKENNVKVMKFIDNKKKETWIFDVPEVLEKGELKKHFQEEQLYFPISLAKIEKHEKKETNSN